MRLITLSIAAGLLLAGAADLAHAAIAGTLNTTTSPWQLSGNNGSAYDYMISSTSYDLGPGTPGASISGAVSNLSLGSVSSYLEIGFVAKERSDGPISWGQPFYMFNNSAYMLVTRDAAGDIILRTGDTDSSVSAGSLNLGQITGFNFLVEIVPNASGPGGDVKVTVNSQTVTGSYGEDNWYGGTHEFDGGNWQHGYAIAQAFAENLNTTHPAGAVIATISYEPELSTSSDGNAVPEPVTAGLVGAAALGLLARRRRSAA
jgi:hypothetical protein